MGQSISKARVAIPSNILCFPHFPAEDELLLTSKNASDSLGKVRNVLNLISGGVANTFAPSQFSKATIFISATTFLFTFLLGRLSSQQQTSNASKAGFVKSSSNDYSTKDKNYNKETVNASENKPCKITNRTLEDALVQLKIDRSIVHAAVSEFKAKIVAIKNRYDRLLSKENPFKDRRLEVVPALSLCEEVLALFRDVSHLFFKNAIISAPFVVSFAGIYTAVAELSLVLIPSYKTSLNIQMSSLKETLMMYKTTCIKLRLSGLKVRPTLPDTMISGAFIGGNSSSSKDPSFYLEDNVMNTSPLKFQHDEYMTYKSGSFQCFDGHKEACEAYKTALEEGYNSFFDPVLHAINSFSGFKNSNDDGPLDNKIYVKDNDDDDSPSIEKISKIDGQDNNHGIRIGLIDSNGFSSTEVEGNYNRNIQDWIDDLEPADDNRSDKFQKNDGQEDKNDSSELDKNEELDDTLSSITDITVCTIGGRKYL